MSGAGGDPTRLAALVGWEGPVASAVDWEDLRARAGHPFPADYRAYVERFPPGDIGVLHVLHPHTGAGIDEYLATVTNYHDAMNDRAQLRPGFPYHFGTSTGDLCLWGVVQADYLLCWHIDDGPPERWPSVVCDTVLSAQATACHPGPAVQLLIDIGEGRNPIPLIDYVYDALPYTFAPIGGPVEPQDGRRPPDPRR